MYKFYKRARKLKHSNEEYSLTEKIIVFSTLWIISLLILKYLFLKII